MSTAPNLRLIADADFDAADLRRRFMRLLSGPVRHVELSCHAAAKILRCDADELAVELEALRERGKLQRRVIKGPGSVLLYSLSGQELAPLMAEPKRKSEADRVVQSVRRCMPQNRNASHVARTRALLDRADRAYQMAAARGRVWAGDVALELGCAQSTAWSTLTMLEQDGRVTSAMEQTAPGQNLRRYYRPAAVPNQQPET